MLIDDTTLDLLLSHHRNVRRWLTICTIWSLAQAQFYKKLNYRWQTAWRV